MQVVVFARLEFLYAGTHRERERGGDLRGERGDDLGDDMRRRSKICSMASCLGVAILTDPDCSSSGTPATLS